MPWFRLDGTPAKGEVRNVTDMQGLDSEGMSVELGGIPAADQPNIFGMTPAMLAERDKPAVAAGAFDSTPILKSLESAHKKLDFLIGQKIGG